MKSEAQYLVEIRQHRIAAQAWARQMASMSEKDRRDMADKELAAKLRECDIMATAGRWLVIGGIAVSLAGFLAWLP